MGWAVVIGLQVASLQAASAQSARPAEIPPAANVNIQSIEQELQKLSGLLLVDPQNPQLLLQKGMHLFDSGRLQAAFDIFDSLRVRFPDQPAPYVNLAAIHARWGQLEEARSLLTQSSALENDQIQTQLSLASVHMGLALEALTKARAINPSNAVAQTQLLALEKLMADPVIIAPGGKAANTDKAETLQATPAPRRERRKSTPTKNLRKDRLHLESLDLSELSAPGVGNVTEPSFSTGKSAPDEVRTTLRAWLKAWSDRSYARYALHYSTAFEPADGATREVWSERKKSLMESARFIQVDINIVSLQVDGPLASVRVNQTYRSDRYSDTARKDLLLRLEGNQWRFISERTLD